MMQAGNMKAQIDRSLRQDAKGFSQLTGKGNNFRNWGIGLVVVGIFCVAVNIFQMSDLFQYSSDPRFWEVFWQVFWNIENTKGYSDLRIALYVYGGPVFIVVGIVLLIVAAVGADNKTKEKNFKLFAASGFVTEGMYVPVNVRLGRNKGTIIILSVPGYDMQAIQNWYTGLCQAALADRKSFSKNLSTALSGQRMTAVSDKVVFASNIYPDAPQGALLQLVTVSNEAMRYVAVWKGGKVDQKTGLAPMTGVFVKTKKLAKGIQ